MPCVIVGDVVHVPLSASNALYLSDAVAGCGSDDAVSRGLCSLVNGYLEALQDAVRLAREHSHESTLLDFMQGMEQRQRQLLSEQLDLHRSDVSSRVSSLADAVSSQVLKVLCAVESSVHQSLERLNGSEVAASVSSSLHGWLDGELESLKAGQASLSSLESRLREVACSSLEPLFARHDALASQLRTLPQEVSSLCVTLSNAASVEGRANLQSRVDEIRTRLDESAASQRLDVQSVREQIAGLVRKVAGLVDGSTKGNVALSKLPVMVKGVLSDTLARLEHGAVSASTAIATTREQLSRLDASLAQSSTVLGSLQRSSTAVQDRIERLGDQLIASQARKSASARVKGMEGEDQLFELLSDRLPARDSYDVERVSGHAHACDLVVRRAGHPDVRVESKAHGDGTGEKVRAKEVSRFVSDVLGHNVHGVFVSHHARIVGKGRLEVEQLSNGKFVVFVSENQYDVEQLHDVLQLIYKLDSLTTSNADQLREPAGCRRLTPDALRRIEHRLQDHAQKVKALRASLTQSLSILNELSLHDLELELKCNVPSSPDGQAPAPAPVPAPTHGSAKPLHTCPSCDFVCKSRAGLTNHVRMAHAHRPS
jgi:hypothetical protein